MPLNKYRYYLYSIWELLTGVQPWLPVSRAFIMGQPPSGFIIRLRQSGLKFKVRTLMDIWTVKETFLDRFYERYGTVIGNGWSVIDIGGGIGDFTIFVAAKHPNNVVYTFEPNPESVALMEANLQLNRLSNVKVYPEAVWSSGGEVLLDTTFSEPGGYASKNLDATYDPTQKPLIIASLSLQDVFDRTGLAHCNLLKIDCEGAEFPILLEAQAQVFDRIERIIMEYHETVTGNNHQILVEFLMRQGYAVKTYPNTVHEHLGYIYAAR